MIKVLVVDDEKIIRNGLKAILNRLPYDFSWIGEAKNGEDALSKIKEHSPDIVIIDIKMPFKNGIEVIRYVKQTYPHIEFIIISGYSEFDYAEKAINMGVSGYLLKPVSRKKLEKSISNVIKKIDEEKSKKQISNKNKSLKQSNKKLLIEKNINTLIKSEQNQEDFCSVINKLGSTDNQFILTIIHVDNRSFLVSDFRYEDIPLIKFSLKNIIDSIDEANNYIVCDNYNEKSEILLICYGNDKTGLEKYADVITRKLYILANKHLNISLAIGLSSICTVVDIKAYMQARTALDKRFIIDNTRIFKHKNIKSLDGYKFSYRKLKVLERCIEFSETENIKRALEDIFYVENNKNDISSIIRNIYSCLISVILNVCNKNSIHFSKIVDLDNGILSGEVLNSCDTVSDIVDNLYEFLIKIINNHNYKYGCNKAVLVNRIKEYINNCYDENINLDSIANKFSLSTSYLSTLFKKETETNIIKYLTQVRIDNAKRMLKETDMSTLDIAQNVGYDNVRYFYRIFKKHTGLTPSEFKETL